MRLPCRLLMTATLGASLGACGLDYPPVIWSGEHIDYATERDEPLCAGTFHLQDRFVGALADHLGIRLRRRDRILFAYIEEEEIAEFCPSVTATGCARRRSVVSRFPFHRHELVHSVTKLGGWYGPIVFDEGLAEVFGDGLESGTRLPVREVLEGFAYANDEYHTMALFVRFLLDRHGIATFAGFMREAEREDTPAEYGGIFAAHFGESLDAAIAAFEDYPSCSRWNNRIPLLECAEVEPWVGDRLTMRVDVRCDNPEIQGPYGSYDAIAGYRALEIAEAGEYRFVGSSDVDLGLRLTHCGSCADKTGSYLFVTNNTSTIPLTPGRYYLTFEGLLETEATVDLEITRLR